MAFAAETGFPAQARTRGASADLPRRAARGGIKFAASSHWRNRDHHRAMAEGFAGRAEISAAIRRWICCRLKVTYCSFSNLQLSNFNFQLPNSKSPFARAAGFRPA